MSLKSETEPAARTAAEINGERSSEHVREPTQPVHLSNTAGPGNGERASDGTLTRAQKQAPAATSLAARSTQSLAARLTAWYAASAFALILAATGVLYIALERGLDADNDRLLADRIEDVRSVLKNHQDPRTELADQADDTPSPRLHSPVYFRILDGAGQVVIESRGMPDILPARLFPAPTSPAARYGEGQQVRAAGAGQRFRVLSALSPPPRGDQPYAVQVAISLAPQEKLLAEYRRRLWVALSVTLVACVIVGYEIARRGIRPIQNVTDTAKRIRSTTLDARIDAAPMPAELQSLAGEFNEMLDRLQQSFSRISRFSADIAHELRTPVNNLRGVAEVALTKARSREEYHEALLSCIEETVRLSHIIDNLLFLARAEDPRHQIARERLDVAHELEVVAEFYEASATDAGVKIDVQASAPLEVKLNRTLFQRAVGNLLDNSIKHTQPGGTIRVIATHDDGTVRIDVADTGCGIPAEHLPHVFDRLYRVADDRSKHTGGAGLGLAIVKSIAASHGGSVGIQSEFGRGTKVTIYIPRDTPQSS
jgi:two-component system heavy metal sensor histidine kinase CusS